MAFESSISTFDARTTSLNQITTAIQAALVTIDTNKSLINALTVQTRNWTALAEGGTVVQPSSAGYVIEGDSIDAGGGSNTSPWPTQFATLMGVPVKNIAKSGDTLSHMHDDWTLDGNGGPAFSAQYPNFIIAGGTNDIALDNQSVNRLKQLYYGICHKARDAGYTKIWIMTLIPRGGWSADFESRRVAINEAIRADFAYYGADGVIDREAALTLSDLYDNIHPSNDGAAKIAAKAKQVVTAGVVVTPIVTGDIMNTDGTVDMQKRNAIANSYWNDTGANYRMGTQSAPFTNVPTWSGPLTDKFVGAPYPATRIYQLGTFVDEYTDYSSTESQFAFVPNDPVARIGAGGIQGTSFSNYAGSVKPTNNWTRGGAGMDGVEAKFWRNNGYPGLSKPTCCARGQGRPTWNVQTIFFFQDGSFCTVGTNTDANTSFGRLAPGKIPTSAAIMSSNEFALVTVWDVNTNTAEVAIIYLCGLGHGSTIENPDSGEPKGWWGEWNRAYPGLQNLGNNVFFKVVGYMPLPNMKAPTGIACTSGQHRHAYLNGTPPLTNGALSNWVEDESVRQRWVAPNGDRCTNLVRQGMFMVWSKSEKKVEFYDLRPTFDYINKYYFGTRADFLKTRDIGQGANQWPFSLSVAPEQTPTFIKSFDLPSRPTAGMLFAYVYNNAHRQAYLCLEDGVMWTFNCGKYAEPFDGRPGAETGVPSLLVKAFETPIPRNVTSIMQSRERGQNEFVRDSTRLLILCSREEKSVTWYDMVSTTSAGTLVRKAQDSRWVDPVYAEDMENHGTTSYIINVADYEGKAIHALCWGTTDMGTMKGYKFPLLNNEQFNYYGKYDVEGKVFAVHGANVS